MADRRGSIRFVAVTTLLALASACNAMYGPTRLDQNWLAFDSAHFTLYVRPDSFAETNQARLIEVLEDQYAFTLATLGVQYEGRISAFCHTDAGDGALSSNYSGVAYAGTEAVRATCPGPLDGNLFALLQHEANHVLQRNTLGRPGTSFANEGLPSAVGSTRFHSYGKDFLYSWTAAHLASIPPLAQLVDDEQWNGSEVAYKSAASFLAYLLDRAGPASIRALYQTPSASFAAKVQTLYEATLDELDRDWRAFCVAHG